MPWRGASLGATSAHPGGPLPFAYWSILAAAALPYLWVVLAKSHKSFNNATPRTYLAGLEGWRQRANFAQLNAWEAFSPYAAMVIIAVTRNAPVQLVNALCVTFLAARLAHGAAYIANRPTLRSAAWTLGAGCIVGLFVVAL